MILITYICPCLNNLVGLRDTVDSFLFINSQDIALFIVDGCSSDGTIQFLKRISASHQNISFVSRSDSSLYEAVNYGIHHVKSNYIGIVGSGDTFIPAGFHTILNLLKFNQSLANPPIIAASVMRFKAPLIRTITPSLKSPPLLTALNMNICHPSLLLHASHYNFLGLYSESYRIVSDHHFVIRLVNSCLNSDIVYLNVTLIAMSDGGLSKRLGSKPLLFYETVRMYRELFPLSWIFLSTLFIGRNIISLLLYFYRRLFLL